MPPSAETGRRKASSGRRQPVGIKAGSRSSTPLKSSGYGMTALAPSQSPATSASLGRPSTGCCDCWPQTDPPSTWRRQKHPGAGLAAGTGWGADIAKTGGLIPNPRLRSANSASAISRGFAQLVLRIDLGKNFGEFSARIGQPRSYGAMAVISRSGHCRARLRRQALIATVRGTCLFNTASLPRLQRPP
jgi:hypothetical protein